jgi:hypothetical protein
LTSYAAIHSIADMDQQAKALCLAFIKVSVYIRRTELKKRFEAYAYDLLEKTAERDANSISRLIAVLEQFIEFGKTIYEIEQVNADILLAELNRLRTLTNEIAASQLPHSDDLPDLKSLFPSQKKITSSAKSKSLKKSKSAIEKKDDIHENIPQSAFINTTVTDKNDDDPAIRQSAIAEKIRQSNNIPIYLKDIIAAFPNFSERTLRYDLQRLCSQGIIERVGAGGPGSYYQTRVI